MKGTWNQYPLPIFADGDYTVATACSLPVFEFPIPATQFVLDSSGPTFNGVQENNPVNFPYVLKQDFMQFLEYFTPLELGTLHPYNSQPNFQNYVLVAEGQLSDVGGGVVKWTRTYAQVPSSHYEPQIITYTYPGIAPYQSLTTPTTGYGRPPYRGRALTARIQYDYFFVDPAGASGVVGSANGKGTLLLPYDDPASISLINGFAVCYQDTVLGGGIAGGWIAREDQSSAFVSDGYFTLYNNTVAVKTVPGAATYRGMVNDALTNGWSKAKKTKIVLTANNSTEVTPVVDTTNSVFGGLIPAQDSKIVRWMGNIYRRETIWVLAQ